MSFPIPAPSFVLSICVLPVLPLGSLAMGGCVTKNYAYSQLATCPAPMSSYSRLPSRIFVWVGIMPAGISRHRLAAMLVLSQCALNGWLHEPSSLPPPAAGPCVPDRVLCDVPLLPVPRARH
ncbi:hypothetical protein IBTHAUMO2_1000008 [Nitrosopumilaceae archaeon]|nr:hypothetical protein IBTHAUMO2_1000008 [Nitrosopumilaceae archaeon]